MPFALAIVGIVLLVAGVRNKQDELFALVKGDFIGDNNFVFWVVSILVIGAIGYIPKFKPVSTAFLALIIVVLFLSRGVGFFQQFQRALGKTLLNPNVTQNPPTNPNEPVGNSFGDYLKQLPTLGSIQ